MIFTRSVAIFIRACGYFLVLFREEGVPSELLDVLWIAKFAAQAAALCCILERSYATFFANNYENFKRCNFIVTACSGLSYIDASSDLGRKIHSFGYGIFFVVTTTMLIKINRRLVKKSSAGKCRLSERYQLAENIKALRLLVPFVLSITGNAIMLSIGIIFFNVDTVFSLPECRLVPSYLPVFYLVLITTTILNLAAPLYVLYHNRKTLQNRKIGVSELGQTQRSTAQMTWVLDQNDWKQVVGGRTDQYTHKLGRAEWKNEC
ncbi:Protein CBG09758 [Caenorhabditis briggsae]|uniref:Protein CBG09758 n=1 Tax=Caenorhabditis briggsae TaxID=6238 RepID=A8X9K2_CAEBR|nr:Protein CBG09758 [Caenorhabditis briggsae]CAP29317.2 Protein CBG09758 [Caenorhabditis briggsae]